MSIINSKIEVETTPSLVAKIYEKLQNKISSRKVDEVLRWKKGYLLLPYLSSHEFKTGKKSSNREFNGPKGVWTDIGAKIGS